MRTIHIGVLLAALAPSLCQGASAQDRVLAWNDLGMHCLDPDFSIFSILPPFNTLNIQVIRAGQLVTGTGQVQVTYQAQADADGSINTSSIGKTNFWDYSTALFGANLAPDTGLAGYSMPGAANTPQQVGFDNAWAWFHAEGIPFTPIDDGGADNPYPLLKFQARSTTGALLAETVASVPNSKEMECSRCHASGANPAARPSSGWTYEVNTLEDDRFNILRLHDDLQGGTPRYATSLQLAGFDPAGLEATVRNTGTPILCAKCHPSNALPGSGLYFISPMTRAMHAGHAQVSDFMGNSLNAPTGRAACYTCHPGAKTQCLRGAMGKAIGPDGDKAMDCQSCHGDMETVGSWDRQGWFEEPNCQACHAGSATQNPGQIRYDHAFDANGDLRQATTNLFATNDDTPAPGISLYRFSTGHGDLQCSACHGPPHAIYPTSEANDNQQSVAFQGHEGTIQECSSCHNSLTAAQRVNGPHGMHPSNSAWVNNQHGDWVETNGSASCRVCHGTDSRGTILSEAKADRTFNTQFGTKQFYRGFQVGCYACHDGPNDGDANNNSAPVVQNISVSTPSDLSIQIPFQGSDANGTALTYKLITQPQSGTAGWNASSTTYYPDRAFQGTVTYQYAAWDGEVQSQRGTITVQVTAPSCTAEVEEFGFGCPGSNGETPRMTLSGCANPGSTVQLHLDRATPNTFVYMVQGSARQVRELWLGCVLRVASPITLSLVQTDANGELNYDVTLPTGAGDTVVMQAFVLDLSMGTRGTFSNAIEIRLP
ncbi:MAG: Ig-like domain-containing protein [Planctomycetota bacterium]